MRKKNTNNNEKLPYVLIDIHLFRMPANFHEGGNPQVVQVLSDIH